MNITETIQNTQVFTPTEAANYLKLKPQLVGKYLREGVIPARKIGKQWRLSKLELDLWLTPSLSAIVTNLSPWKEIFTLGDQVGQTVAISDQEVLSDVQKLRRQRGLTPARRS